MNVSERVQSSTFRRAFKCACNAAFCDVLQGSSLNLAFGDFWRVKGASATTCTPPPQGAIATRFVGAPRATSARRRGTAGVATFTCGVRAGPPVCAPAQSRSRSGGSGCSLSDAHVRSHAHACRQASLRCSCTHKHTRASTAHKAPRHHFGARPWPLFNARWPGSCRACDAHTSIPCA